MAYETTTGPSRPPPATHEYNLRSTGITVAPCSGPLQRSRPTLDQTPLLSDDGSLSPPNLSPYDGSERVEEGRTTETNESMTTATTTPAHTDHTKTLIPPLFCVIIIVYYAIRQPHHKHTMLCTVQNIKAQTHNKTHRPSTI